MVQGKVCELKPAEVLMLAIDIERISGKRLREFADFFVDHSAEAARLFAEMAAEVEGHRSRLEGLYEQRFRPIHTPNQGEGQKAAPSHGLDEPKDPVSSSLALPRSLETLYLRRALEIVVDRFGEAELQVLLRKLSDLEAVLMKPFEASFDH